MIPRNLCPVGAVSLEPFEKRFAGIFVDESLRLEGTHGTRLSVWRMAEHELQMRVRSYRRVVAGVQGAYVDTFVDRLEEPGERVVGWRGGGGQACGTKRHARL